MSRTLTVSIVAVLCSFGSATTKPPTGSCIDYHQKCKEWAAVGECDRNPKWMLDQCQQSCGQCFEADIYDLVRKANAQTQALKWMVRTLLCIGILAILKIYFGGKWCKSTTTLNGKTAIVTGANTGIGIETARDLVWRGAHVILACRNIEKGLEAAADITRTTQSNTVEVKHLDLSSFQSIQQFAQEVKDRQERVDILINNAGYIGPYFKTVDNLENTFQVNYLGPTLLIHLLLDQLKACTPSRIVNVNSCMHFRGDINFDDLFMKGRYVWYKAYSNSKLAQMLFTLELSRKLEGSGVTVNAADPGLVKTEIQRNWKLVQFPPIKLLFNALCYVFFKTPIQGAQTSIYCAVAPELEGVTGCYFKECAVAECSEKAKDEGVAKKLWEVSERLTQIGTER